MKANTVLISVDSNSILKGARAIKNSFVEKVKQVGLASEVDVFETGSFGVYVDGVIAVIFPEGIYYNIKTNEDVNLIVEEHLLKGRKVKHLLLDKSLFEVKAAEKPAIAKEERIVLKDVGRINPDSIDEYIACDGYMAIAKALKEMKPEEIINVISQSELVGRGGAGFSTGKKWEFTAKAKDTPKYVICNADEGEPGTFKDRLILEGMPHRILEGMLLAGYAVSSNTGYIYIRGEYISSIEKIKSAINDAYKYGLLGKNILNSGFDFDIFIRIGGGAYVCGEETALFESMEGKSGKPRYKPPFPPTSGFYKKPTVINNVETLANVPAIILNGAEWFKSFGVKNSYGTKVFSLVGNIVNRGIVEASIGITARELVYNYGGGVPSGKKLKMVQTGGTAGSFIKGEKLDAPITFQSGLANGVSMGSGVILAIDETHCAVDIAKEVLRFFKHESCGKCTPCREGTRAAFEILDNISRGKETKDGIKQLRNLANIMAKTSFCGLGQAVAVPLNSILDNFEDEFNVHIEEKHCEANVCRFKKPQKKEKVLF